METSMWMTFLFFTIVSIQSSDAFDYCYRAVFNTTAAISGTVASRRSEIETAVSDILNEFETDPNLGFTVNSSNTTLDQLDGDTTSSEFVVSICLTNSSKNQNDFTDILQTFNITTQINSSAVVGNDFDECTSNFTSCSVLATCTNTNGSSTCTCPDTYADKSTNGTDGEICELPTNHTCLVGGVEVSAYNPYFSSQGISETTLTLGSCSGNLSGDVITFSGECSPLKEFNGTHIISKWNLTNVEENPVFTIGTYVIIPIICVTFASDNVTSSFNGSAAEPIQFSQNLFSNELSQTFDVSVNAFSDVAFVNPLVAGGVVQTDQDLSFRMGPSAGFISDNIKTVCRGLSSSPAEGFGEPIQLIRGGCVESNPSYSKLLNTVVLIDQGVSATASLSLGAHFHINSLQTQLRFEVEICLDTGGSSSCQPTCNSRRRRSIVHLLSKRNSERVRHGIGFFAFTRAKNDECTRDCGYGECVFDPLRRQECICAVSAYRDTNGTCILGLLGETVEQNNGQNLMPLMIGLFVGSGLLVVLLIVIGLFYVVRKRNQSATVKLPNS